MTAIHEKLGDVHIGIEETHAQVSTASKATSVNPQLNIVLDEIQNVKSTIATKVQDVQGSQWRSAEDHKDIYDMKARINDLEQTVAEIKAESKQ